MVEVLVVAAGGAVGSGFRYAISQWVVTRFSPEVPWHTFVVNVTGAFLLGVLMAVAVERGLVSHEWRLFLGVGVLGGYTTFSTLAFEAVELAGERMGPQALAYALGSLVIGIVAAWAGVQLGRML